jgi:FkbM family methyltransferase
MSVRNSVRWALRRAGIDVVRYDERHVASLRRAGQLRRRAVTVALDVGANDGLYGQALRRGGYRGRIVSFEPQRSAYERLSLVAADDPLWDCRPVAVGESAGEAVLNLAANSSSSSLLAMEEIHARAAPESRYIGAEPVAVIALDDLLGELLQPGDRCFLKVDVQGAELAVIRGAARVLEQTVLLEAELSLVPLYRGAPLLGEVIDHLQQGGFALLGLEPVLLDPEDGSVLQLDGLFGRAT